MDFSGKVVIVTGASAGMGKSSAIKFGQRGAKVVVNYASSEQRAMETVNEIVNNGGQAIAIQADVGDKASAERLVKETVAKYGGLDILINNAGTTKFIPFADLDAAEPEIWNQLYTTNVIGSFLCARAAAKEMKKVGGGSIVNNASVSGHRPNGSSIPYVVSKAAVLQMTRALAVALGPDIRVNSVSPGYIADTLWTAKRENFDRDKTIADAAEASLLKRTGTADEVADAMLFLASDHAKFITGEDILVDGGRQFKI